MSRGRAAGWPLRIPRLRWVPVAVFAALYAGSYGYEWVLLESGDSAVAIVVRFFLVSGTALAYGFQRARGTHPLSRPGYAGWLATTPWTSSRPLPFGPVLLTWFDAAVVGVLGGLLVIGVTVTGSGPLAGGGSGGGSGGGEVELIEGVVGSLWAVSQTLGGWGAPWVPWWLFATGWVSVLFLGGHVFPALAQLRGRPWERRAVLALVPFTVSPSVDLLQALAALVAATAVNQWGQRRVLERLPYDEVGMDKDPAEDLAQQAEALTGSTFGGVGPRSNEPPPGVAALLANRAIVSWWLWTVADIGLASRGGAAGFAQVLVDGWGEALAGETMAPLVLWWVWVAALTIGRIGKYRGGFGPPISLKGRLRTGRLVLPRYDQVWLGPLALIVTGEVGPGVLVAAGLPMAAVPGAGVFLLLVVLRFFPPSLETWRYTGQHHVNTSIDEADELEDRV
ncbi:MAG: hypothetical protein AAFX76_12680 [Planctomycetota bacterium]